MSYHRWQNYFSPNFDARSNIDLLRDSSHYLDIFSINNIYGARPKRRCIKCISNGFDNYLPISSQTSSLDFFYFITNTVWPYL